MFWSKDLFNTYTFSCVIPTWGVSKGTPFWRNLPVLAIVGSASLSMFVEHFHWKMTELWLIIVYLLSFITRYFPFPTTALSRRWMLITCRWFGRQIVFVVRQMTLKKFLRTHEKKWHLCELSYEVWILLSWKESADSCLLQEQQHPGVVIPRTQSSPMTNRP